MTIRTMLTLLSIAALTGLTACSTTNEAETAAQAEEAETRQQAQTEERTDPSQADRQQMMMQSCPMQVEGTTRNVAKLDDAVAMDFTTGGDVDDLRERVAKMARMHGQHHAEGGMIEGQQHGHMAGEGMHHGKMHGQMTEEQREMRQQMMQMMSGVTVETEEIEGGMRMRFTPQDAEKLDQVHQMMQRHVEMTGQDAQCSMMQMMGGPVEDSER